MTHGVVLYPLESAFGYDLRHGPYRHKNVDIVAFDFAIYDTVGNDTFGTHWESVWTVIEW